jgi:UDP-glucose 4-epimerase
LRSDGFDAVGLVRPGRRTDAHCVEIAEWTADALAAALTGFDVVVHAASVVHRPDAPADEYTRFNIDGTRALLDACRRAGVRRVVFISTIKVYGDDVRGEIDEETPVVGEGGYALSKVEAERLVLNEPSRGGPSGIVLRLAPVFGPGDKGNIRMMIRAISRRRFALPGDGSNRKSIVHISTVARVVKAAITSEVVGSFVVADSQAPSMRELVDTIATALGRPRPVAVPAPILRLAAAAAEAVFGIAGRPAPVTRDLIRKSLAPTVCRPTKIETALRLDCHVDLPRAIAEEVEWMRREALL